MTAEERAQILALLEEGRLAVPASVTGVTEEQGKRRPGPSLTGTARWSILECVEHIGFSEDYLFGQILKAAPSSTPLINLRREEKMLAYGTDRSRRIESPLEGYPVGAFATLADAVAPFLASRTRTIAFVQANHDDLRRSMTWHPILGAANCYEMLISMGVHALRHVKQIEEIKAGMASEQRPIWS